MPTLKISKNFLNIIEVFASVQGETSLVGLPTTFIRLAACNLRCTWCDTPYSFSRGEPWELETIIQKVEQLGCPYVCITGGEPLLQTNVYPLMAQLCNRRFFLTLETGGSLSVEKVDPRVSVILDIKCPGSGMSAKNEWSNIPRLRLQDEIKFVLMGREDYLYAKDICDQHKLFQRVKHILVSPVHGVLDPKDLVSWILEDHLPVRLNLQLHKYIWDPLKRGV
jgi:7-carboxy-7-deazaguanine synthase